MATTTNQQTILEALESFPRGAGVETIGAALPKIPRRTLQRLLGELVESGQVARVGKGRATIYALAAATKTAVDDDYSAYIQLSDTSRELLTQLRKPLAARAPSRGLALSRVVFV